MAKPGHANRLRTGRFSESGRIYLVTVVCKDRKPTFADFGCGRCAVRAMVMLQQSATTLCYVVMPDHVHWLLQLVDDEGLSSIVQRFKSYATKLVHRYTDSQAKIWMPGFHDRALRREDNVIDAARYVVANPLRAGLVKSIGAYALWDAVWL